MDNSPLVAFIADADDRMVYSSEPMPLTPASIGASMWDLLPAEYVESYRPAMHAARRTGETQQLTAQAPKDGGVGWFQTHYFALPDGAVGGVGLDVTDLARLKEHSAPPPTSLRPPANASSRRATPRDDASSATCTTGCSNASSRCCSGFGGSGNGCRPTRRARRRCSTRTSRT
jgi:hypothetical protein